VVNTVPVDVDVRDRPEREDLAVGIACTANLVCLRELSDELFGRTIDEPAIELPNLLEVLPRHVAR